MILPLPSLIQTFSVTEISETLKGSLTEFFGTVRQKFFDGKSWHSPAFYPNFFDTEINETLKGSPTKIFGTVRQKFFDGKSWYSPPPPSYPNYFDTEINETLKDSPPPTEIFGTVRQKILDGKSWYPPPLLHKLFRYRKISETQHGRVHLRNFSALWDKKIRRKILIPLPPSLMHKIFRYPKFCDTPKCSPTKFFGTVRQKILNKKKSRA